MSDAGGSGSLSNGLHPSCFDHVRFESQRQYWNPRAYARFGRAPWSKAARVRGMYTRKTDSATPFCEGVYLTDSSRWMPCSSQKWKASFETYSGPPSDAHSARISTPNLRINAAQSLYERCSHAILCENRKTDAREVVAKNNNVPAARVVQRGNERPPSVRVCELSAKGRFNAVATHRRSF